MKNVNIINISDFKRTFFTLHGQHLNKFGKKVLSRRIADISLNMDLSHKVAEIENKISLKVIEDSMDSYIDKYCSNSEVSYAH